MHGPTRGEYISPIACCLNVWRLGRCGNPMRVAFSASSFGSCVVRAKRWLIETLWAARLWRVIASAAKAERGVPGESPGKAIAGGPWKGETQGRHQR